MSVVLNVNNVKTTNLFKKCGEITTRGENEFFLVCSFCDEVFLQLNTFIGHVGRQHLHDVYAKIITIKNESDEYIENISDASLSNENKAKVDVIPYIKDEQPMELDIDQFEVAEAEQDDELKDTFIVDEFDDDSRWSEIEQSETERNSDNGTMRQHDILKDKDALTVAIIAEYKKHPLLWNKKHPLNLGRASREEAFQLIVSNVNKQFNSDLELKTLKVQISELLKRHHGELLNKKRAESKGKPFIPSWHADQLKFLNPQLEYQQHNARLRDNCVICRNDMRRQPTVRLLPCRHLLHVKCSNLIKETKKCPICGEDVEDNAVVDKTVYKKYSDVDRVRIVEAANRGEDWCNLASSLGVVYKTAYSWVQSGRVTALKKGGGNTKKLTENEIATMIQWLEDDSTITLTQLVTKVVVEFRKHISVSTVGNYLDGKLFTTKNVHQEATTMNSLVNKRKRAEFVTALYAYIEQEIQIVYIGETNFNLFCRRHRGRVPSEAQVTLALPPSRYPNIHLIGAICTSGILAMKTHRSSFEEETANEWLYEVLQKWTILGNDLSELIIVCDNAPCHIGLERVINNGSVNLLRLQPYSPMLNPIENIWAKIKSYIKTHISLPEASGPYVIGERQQYLEALVREAKDTIVTEDCARAIQYSSYFFTDALNLRDMPVNI